MDLMMVMVMMLSLRLLDLLWHERKSSMAGVQGEG